MWSKTPKSKYKNDEWAWTRPPLLLMDRCYMGFAASYGGKLMEPISCWVWVLLKPSIFTAPSCNTRINIFQCMASEVLQWISNKLMLGCSDNRVKRYWQPAGLELECSRSFLLEEAPLRIDIKQATDHNCSLEST